MSDKRNVLELLSQQPTGVKSRLTRLHGYLNEMQQELEEVQTKVQHESSHLEEQALTIIQTAMHRIMERDRTDLQALREAWQQRINEIASHLRGLDQRLTHIEEVAQLERDVLTRLKEKLGG